MAFHSSRDKLQDDQRLKCAGPMCDGGSEWIASRWLSDGRTSNSAFTGLVPGKHVPTPFFTPFHKVATICRFTLAFPLIECPKTAGLGPHQSQLDGIWAGKLWNSSSSKTCPSPINYPITLVALVRLRQPTRCYILHLVSITVYKLHLGDIIRAGLRWQRAVMATTNDFISLLSHFSRHKHGCLLHAEETSQEIFISHHKNAGMHRVSAVQTAQLPTHTQKKGDCSANMEERLLMSLRFFSVENTMIVVQGLAPVGRFIMMMLRQIIRYTWRRRFQGRCDSSQNKTPVPANIKVGGKKPTPLSHWLSSHGGNVLFIYPHLNALCWGGLHFVQADAFPAKLSHLFLISAWHKMPSDWELLDSRLHVSMASRRQSPATRKCWWVHLSSWVDAELTCMDI